MLRKEGEDVSDSNLDGIDFYRDAMELFYEAGHVSTLDPEFFNHSAQEFVYFDNSTDVALTKDQCYLLGWIITSLDCLQLIAVLSSQQTCFLQKNIAVKSLMTSMP